MGITSRNWIGRAAVTQATSLCKRRHRNTDSEMTYLSLRMGVRQNEWKIQIVGTHAYITCGNIEISQVSDTFRDKCTLVSL